MHSRYDLKIQNSHRQTSLSVQEMYPTFMCHSFMPSLWASWRSLVGHSGIKDVDNVDL